MNIYLYETNHQNFLPLTYLKPLSDLRCGIFTFKERIQKIYPTSTIKTISIAENSPLKPGLYINSSAILYKKLPEKEGKFISDDQLIGFKINHSGAVEGSNLKKIEVSAKCITYPWELITYNKESIIKDYNLIGGRKNITIGKNAVIEKGAYLNTDSGPIYIEANARIRATSLVDGPCYIGEKALVDGAKIRPGTTIGKGCRIGGEVEESIFSDWSNKHHEGFVGHSYIGEWVNLGALTTTSDLKNTYGTVKVKLSDKEIDTGILKLGSIIGDHTKTGIGTLLTTGCIIGCFANIYGGGLFPKYVPSFSWGTKDKLEEYELAKAIEVAKKVMSRRGITLSPSYKLAIKKSFELTKKERVF